MTEHIEYSEDEKSGRLKRTLNITLIRAIFLAILTITTGIITSSLSIITEAVHISIDIITSLIAMVSIKKALKPPDDEHQYGHGKFASLGGLVEGVLITIISIFITFVAILRIKQGSVKIEHSWLGLIIIVIAGIVNTITFLQLKSANKDLKITAISGETLHLLGDILISISILIGFIIAMFTDFWYLDSILAIGISIFMIIYAINIVKKSTGCLMDRRIDDDEMEKLTEIINDYENPIIGFHEIRTARKGPFLSVDMHMDVCAREDINTVHDLMESFEKRIKTAFWRASVLIHPEPCEQYPEDCDTPDCPLNS
jgi:cation diffusion facilitator family transporter